MSGSEFRCEGTLSQKPRTLLKIEPKATIPADFAKLLVALPDNTHTS